MKSLKHLSKSDLVSASIMLVLVISLVLYVISRKEGIRNNSVYTKGVIVGIRNGVRGNINLYYKFTVDGVQYTRFSTTEYCDDCKNGCCHSGDSAIIKYQAGNPSNSALVQNLVQGEKLYY